MFLPTTTFNKVTISVQISFMVLAATASGHEVMTLVTLPTSSSPGGRCMDGTMAGYYIRDGEDESLFVIHLEGGGHCMTKETCDKRRNGKRGSSKHWSQTLKSPKGGFLDTNCDKNPIFCRGKAAYIGYCTSDTHRGSVAEPSEDTWGYYFDGHLNFKIIIEQLISDHGLGNAQHVLLTGGSAGGLGAYYNVDWLADRLPKASVKAVPIAGWFFPGALANDLPSIYQPSDYPHFAAGVKGNFLYNMIHALDPGVAPFDLWQLKDILSQDCLANRPKNEWFACTSMHIAYKYIKSPLFTIHAQYDYYQIYVEGLAPSKPENVWGEGMLGLYIEMVGRATRASLQSIIDQDYLGLTNKSHSDGVFAPSCNIHGVGADVLIYGQSYMPIVVDWFFQNGNLDQYHKLIETCPKEDNKDMVLPCNTNDVCQSDVQTASFSVTKIQKCATSLNRAKCLQSFMPETECMKCALNDKASKITSGCALMVHEICAYNEVNDIADIQGKMKLTELGVSQAETVDGSKDNLTDIEKHDNIERDDIFLFNVQVRYTVFVAVLFMPIMWKRVREFLGGGHM